MINFINTNLKSNTEFNRIKITMSCDFFSYIFKKETLLKLRETLRRRRYYIAQHLLHHWFYKDIDPMGLCLRFRIDKKSGRKRTPS